jgi:hypothetical protein
MTISAEDRHYVLLAVGKKDVDLTEWFWTGYEPNNLENSFSQSQVENYSIETVHNRGFEDDHDATRKFTDTWIAPTSANLSRNKMNWTG